MPYLGDPREVGQKQIVSDTQCWQHDCVLRWRYNWNWDLKTWKSCKLLSLDSQVLRGFFHFYLLSQGYEQIQALFQMWLWLSFTVCVQSKTFPRSNLCLCNSCDGQMGSSQSLDPNVKSSKVHSPKDFLKRYLFKLTSVQMISSWAHLLLILMRHRNNSVQFIIWCFLPCFGVVVKANLIIFLQ